MKTTEKILVSIMMFVSLALWGGSTAQAIPVHPLEASVALQGAVPDSDFYLLTEFFGFSLNEMLTYSSTTDVPGWSSTLSGVYEGTSLNVTYTGDVSAFPGGPITWTSSGFYGADAWSGSGSAVISETALGFTIDFLSYSLTVGANTGSIDATIDALRTGPELEWVFTDTTSEITVNGMLLDRHIKWSEKVGFDKSGQVVTLSDIDVFEDGKKTETRIINKWKEGVGWVPLNAFVGPRSFTGFVTTVPEPSTLLLLGCGLAGLVLLGRKRILQKP